MSETKKVSIDDVAAEHHEGTVGVDFRALIAKNVNAPNYYLRVLDVAPGGHTPDHSHPWEHEVFVASGRGGIVLASGKEAIKEGDALLVAPDERHMFMNDSRAPLRLVCVIPRPKGDR